ncbi:DUF4241 domain-containing protein [Epilithonimonas vandammei]|uniref:DUF4241 domain-containing protein n=1 Tax=Epilithonimonas vandammei TaxID=2487072 RepID=A0A3G8Y2C0_9FLAO|nr:DUF4241 domain-containing protein [Epilithonimonas vandammei]AZI39519.1 DUF4241 domain-containing protein [Epilithonimonas vandammei]
MIHIENIKKLFSRDFVENPLLETYEVGKVHISSGKIVASDALISPDHSAFNQGFPKGDFQVLVHKERESNCIAYAEIVFDKNQLAENWTLALCGDQNLEDLKEGEIFGYPVESGMGSFMDKDAQSALNNLEQDLFHKKGSDFMGIYEEFFHAHFFDEKGAVDQFAVLKPYDSKPENIVAFETGYGEGFYATYIGYSKDNQPVKLISEFIEIETD